MQITITDNYVDVTVPESVAEQVIRGWFCNTGLSKKAAAAAKAAGLRGSYDWPDSNIVIGYRTLPGRDHGESLSDYAERVADAVNDRLGAEWSDDRVHLFADPVESDD